MFETDFAHSARLGTGLRVLRRETVRRGAHRIMLDNRRERYTA